MKDDIGSTPEGSDGEYSLDEDDQLQPEDTLDDRGVDDVLDEGYSPPDYAPKGAVHGLTSREQAEGEREQAESQYALGVTGFGLLGLDKERVRGLVGGRERNRAFGHWIYHFV